MNLDAQRVAILGEASHRLQGDALLDVLEDGGVAGLVAHHEQAQPAVLQDLEGFVIHVAARVGGPAQAQRAHLLGDGPRPFRVRGERVVVEEDLLHAGKEAAHLLHFFDHVAYRARAVGMPGRHLRPEAERTAGRTPAAGIERDVGILAVRAVVFAEVQVAGVDVGDERQSVQLVVGQRGPLQIVVNPPVAAVADAADVRPLPPFGHLFHGVVELLARRDVDGLGNLEGLFGLCGRMPPDEGDRARRVPLLDQLRGPRVQFHRRRAGVQHDEIVFLGNLDRFGLLQSLGRRIQHAAVFDHAGRIAQPRRIPERPHLAGRLIARARPTVEILVRRRIQEQSTHFGIAPSRSAPGVAVAGVSPSSSPSESAALYM